MIESTTSSDRPRRRGKLIAISLAALLLLYAASPYYSVWRFGETLQARDLNALATRVDFPRVRDSLKKQIRDHFLGAPEPKKKNDLVAQLLTAAGPSLLDQLIDAYVTPDGLATIIGNPAPIKNASSLASLSSLSSGERKKIDWSKARRAFFTSPRDFAVDHEGITLRFRFNGLGWKLREIDLHLTGGTTAVSSQN